MGRCRFFKSVSVFAIFSSRFVYRTLNIAISVSVFGFFQLYAY